MSDFPTGTVSIIILLNLVATFAISVLLGVVVARAAQRRILVGVLVGGLVPVAGPLTWMLIEALRAPTLISVRRLGSRTPGLLTSAGLLICGGVVYVLCTPYSWGEVHGSYHEYALAADQSAADTGVGMLATLGTALLLLAGAATAMVYSAWRRIAVVMILAGASWLALSINSLLVFNALDGLSETVSGASGGSAEVTASPGTGLWLVMLAGALALTGGIWLAFLRKPASQELSRPLSIPAESSSRELTATVNPEPAADDYWNQPLSTWSTPPDKGGWDFE